MCADVVYSDIPRHVSTLNVGGMVVRIIYLRVEEVGERGRQRKRHIQISLGWGGVKGVEINRIRRSMIKETVVFRTGQGWYYGSL